MNILFVMAQVLLGGFSWKFRAITSLTDELNSSHHDAVFHREGRKRVVGCCAGSVFLLLGFGFFFFLDSLKFQFLSFKIKRWIAKIFPSPGCHSVFWGVTLSNGAR